MRKTMANGKEIWDSADELLDAGGARSANAMRFYALSKMLAEAETSMLMGEDVQCLERLRDLQVYCEKMLAVLSPACKRPNLAAA
jgi:hypothetical protein